MIRRSTAALLFLSCAAVLAQQGGNANAGQVMGHVVCGDTDAPARFASVQLVPEHASAGNNSPLAGMDKDADFGKVMTKAINAAMKGSAMSSLTTLDGSFSIEKVPAGVYYVVAQLPGYQSPMSQFSAVERLRPDEAMLKAVAAGAEKIVVQPGQWAQVDVRLQRGASVSGTVHYDDGSPTPGVAPVLMALQPDGKWKDLSPSLLPIMTDDRGHFRFYGLPAGKYAVRAPLPTTQASASLGGNGNVGMTMHVSPGDALVMYSGGATRPKDIKPTEVGVGDEVDGVDVVFPLSGLHVVAGAVVAKADNHALNSGTVVLLDSETKATVRSCQVQRDGTFRMNYVPDGDYTLKLTGAADSEVSGDADNDITRAMSSHTLKSYGSVEQPLMLRGDASNLTLQAPDQGGRGSGN